MLAYLFWHWQKDSVSPSDYADALRRFHGVLAASPPTGFIRSMCFRLRGATWANGGGDAFEDWYLVDGSAALDPLNDAAISGRRQAPHNDAAAAAAGGTGGLYRLRRGHPAPTIGVEHWFGKPEGMSYDALNGLLQPCLERGNVALWGRQMTLGPAREFCLQASEALVLPRQLDALTIPLRPVWPDDGV